MPPFTVCMVAGGAGRGGDLPRGVRAARHPVGLRQLRRPDYRRQVRTQELNENKLIWGLCSMMNPGWKQPDDLHPLNHSLVGDPDVGLTDFIVKNKIFNFFLYLGCVPLTEEHALMSRMMSDQNTLWKKPVEVRLPHHKRYH